MVAHNDLLLSLFHYGTVVRALTCLAVLLDTDASWTVLNEHTIRHEMLF